MCIYTYICINRQRAALGAAAAAAHGAISDDLAALATTFCVWPRTKALV